METVKFGNLKEQSYKMKESLRALKTNVQFCGDDIKTLLITSAVPNEGKSTVALNLARSLTESGKRVLLIDTDMRKSVDGLAAIVQQNFQLDPFSNNLFIFCGRRHDRLKALLWRGDGFLLLYKRLDNGRFR